jgi:Ca-activated chloride channel family protein
VQGRKTRLCCLGLVVIVLAVGTVIAQTRGPLAPASPPAEFSPDSNRPIRLNVAMVLVNVSVTDPEDRPLNSLQKNDFRVFENEIEQEILTFSHEDVPISIGLLFDTSGSMADKKEKAIRAALQVLQSANPEDEFFLVSFGSRARLEREFTSNIEDLQSEMASMVPKGRTALLDAIALGVDEMKNARNRRRALVIISDGGDNSSRHNLNQIRTTLQEADCQIFSMGVFDDASLLHTREERQGPALLAEFAERTGGRSFAVSSADELPHIAAKIGVALRDRYVLGYKPDSAFRAGAWRSIKVKIAQPAGSPALRVLAKNGYYAPAN